MLKPKLIFTIIFFSLFISSSAFPYPCSEAFDISLFENWMKDSLSQVVKPGSIEKVRLEPCGPGCLKLVSETSLAFEVELDSNVSSPEFHVTRKSKLLRMPIKHFSDIPPAANDLRYWLTGHELHPYMESAGPIMIKPVQSVAFEAYKETVQSGAKSFLHVLPTGVGKTLVFTKALVDYLKRRSKENSIAIVTVDQIRIVNQLAEAMEKEITESAESLDIQVVNWNNKKQRTVFSHLISETSSMADATVLVMTSQSLKNILNDPNSERYKQISKKLSTIFIDEAHHLGAELTKEVLMGIKEESGAFLYGTTATPIHHEVNLRDLFEKVHWSYLNDRDSLFQDHPSEAILRQLSIAIERGDLTPFDNLYFIAEDILKRDDKEENIFVSENQRRVLNPDHYQKLAQVIYPILNSNKKGFFVTATVKEAERLTTFLKHTFPEIEFSSYHYRKTSEERKNIISRFEENESSHYLVTVRALEEGVNLPELSAYIDLNASVPIKQMLQRIGRILRLYPDKISSDIVLLIDYRDEQIAKDLLNILDVIKQVSFNKTKREDDVSEESASNREILLSQPEAKPLNREDLIKFQKTLEDIARNFWSKTTEKLSWEEGLKKVREAKLPNRRAYPNWQKDHPDMPGNPTQHKPYEKYWKGWTHFLGNEKLPWEEGLKKVREAKVPGLEAYKEWQKDHPDMPGNPGAYKPWQKYWKGWPHFLGKREIEKLPWEEGLKKVREAKLSGQGPYIEWQKDHPDMPSNPDAYKPYQRYWQGWTHFLGNEKLPWEEGLKKVREAKVPNKEAYPNWRKDHPDMPGNPDAYKPWQKYWKGWTHFLGNEKLPWEEALKKVREAKVPNRRAYPNWQKDHPDMPRTPDEYTPWQKYWKGWTHFLGNKKLPWEEGLKKVREAKLSGEIAYKKWQKDHPDMPSNPTQHKPYEKYWKGWTHFLGNEKLPWEEGLKKVREAKVPGLEAYKEWKKNHISRICLVIPVYINPGKSIGKVGHISSERKKRIEIRF